MSTSASIRHRFDIEFPRWKFIDYERRNPSGKNNIDSTWITLHQFNIQNRWNIDEFSTSFFSMSLRSWIGLTSKLATRRETGSDSILCCGNRLISSILFWAKSETWKTLLIRCKLNVQFLWTSNIYISFTLKYHYCNVQFVGTQHNLEITHLGLIYTGRKSNQQKCSIKKTVLKNFGIFT